MDIFATVCQTVNKKSIRVHRSKQLSLFILISLTDLFITDKLHKVHNNTAIRSREMVFISPTLAIAHTTKEHVDYRYVSKMSKQKGDIKAQGLLAAPEKKLLYQMYITNMLRNDSIIIFV